ncbi:MAG: hypothetical protein RSB91_02040 [Clostridia bacterium]
MLQTIVNALLELRSPFASYENDIHGFVEARLLEAGLPFIHEAKIGSGCRIDYLVGDVGIEIKKGKPAPATLLKQLRRYAACESISALVVVTQRAVRLPDTVCAKPLRAVSLNRLWGVALP